MTETTIPAAAAVFTELDRHFAGRCNNCYFRCKIPGTLSNPKLRKVG